MALFVSPMTARITPALHRFFETVQLNLHCMHRLDIKRFLRCDGCCAAFFGGAGFALPASLNP